ncbi:MAG: hypothetical protein M3O30_10710 [Planctomycetota bacterium]|nr:hypothetical protein [Planctomycetota bacterium]
MNHHDAELSDVLVVLEPETDMTMENAVAQLQAMGLSVTQIDEENDVVEGTILSSKAKGLEMLVFVKYVRNIFNYIADFPPDDARNLDKDDGVGDEEVDDAGA